MAQPFDETWQIGDTGHVAEHAKIGKHMNDEAIFVTDYGATGDGATDDTAAIEAAIAAAPTYGVVYFPAGVYRGSISVQRSNLALVCDPGQAVIKLLDTGTAYNVIEIGDTDWAVWPPASLTNVTIDGLTVDGNRATLTDPNNDVLGWGLAITNATRCQVRNFAALNCWSGGVGHFINSDYSHFSDIYTYNCGYTTYAGGEPGFDVNSCDHSTYRGIVVDTCRYGARILDNCEGLDFRAAIKDAVASGFNYLTASTNIARNNRIDLEVTGGCSDYAVGVGSRTYSSEIHATIYNVTGKGLYVASVEDAANYSMGNRYVIQTHECGAQAALIYQDANEYEINSYRDGRTGGAGTSFAVQVHGSNNRISAQVVDTGTPHVRGITVESGATDNIFTHLKLVNVVQAFEDAGTRTVVLRAGAQSVASTGDLMLPYAGEVITVTGTTGITSIFAGVGNCGRRVTLIFADILSVTDGNNLKLAGNFSTSADDALTLVCDGTNWYEVSRSAN